jgi:hypothetical protein
MTDSKPPINSDRFTKKKNKNIKLTDWIMLINTGLLAWGGYAFVALGYASTTITNIKNVLGILPKEEVKNNQPLHDVPLKNSASAASAAVPQAPIAVATGCYKMAPSAKDSPKWIGVKIKRVYEKNFTNYCNTTTLVYTDNQSLDFSILRNVDQDLSSLTNRGQGDKKNSLHLTARLFGAETEKSAVCLEVYGGRNTEESEVINIIKIEGWKSNKNYDKLNFKERNSECEQNQGK